MNGSISASVVAPPSPGSSPTQKPTPMPSSMKAKAFHCSTRSRPWMNASSTAPNYVLCTKLFAELDVLREFVDHVLGLREHFAHHLERLVARGVLEIELGLLCLGDERGILDRLRKGVAIDLDDLCRRARWKDVGPRHHFRRPPPAM